MKSSLRQIARKLSTRMQGLNYLHRGIVLALDLICSTIAGALAYAVLYLAKTYFYGGLLLHGLTPEAAALTVVSKLPATTFNAVVAISGAPILAIAISKTLEKAHLSIGERPQ